MPPEAPPPLAQRVTSPPLGMARAARPCPTTSLPPPPSLNRTPDRTPDHVEEKVVRLHVEQPHLGAWQHARLPRPRLPRRTRNLRGILIRRQDLVTTLQQARRPNQIRVGGPRQLWGADLPSSSSSASSPSGSWAWSTTTAAASSPLSACAGPRARRSLASSASPSRTTARRSASSPIAGLRFVPLPPRRFSPSTAFANLRQVDRFCARLPPLAQPRPASGSWDGRTPDEVLLLQADAAAAPRSRHVASPTSTAGSSGTASGDVARRRRGTGRRWLFESRAGSGTSGPSCATNVAPIVTISGPQNGVISSRGHYTRADAARGAQELRLVTLAFRLACRDRYFPLTYQLHDGRLQRPEAV